MTLPEKPTQSISIAKTVSFSPAIPVVRSLSGVLLEKEGWTRKGSEYTKGAVTLRYDGVYFWNGQFRCQFMEDINQDNK